MKKALALVLALVMTLSLCACGQKETTPDNTPSTTGDGTTTVADANKDADIYSWMRRRCSGASATRTSMMM